MTLLGIYNTATTKPVLVVKGSQYFLLQSLLDGNMILGISMEAHPIEGYIGTGCWTVISADSTGWAIVGVA